MPLPIVRQAGAIPVRDGRVCLVTSRTGRRWVIPKGWIDPGHTPARSAEAEAWEEAGLEGQLGEEPVGLYRYEKAGRPHVVTVFVLEVTEEHDDWPEADERTRGWFTLAEAVERVDEPDLQFILREVLRGAPSRSAAK
jgi:8-oxo-dGTP pyrophosphatase MutT (NUDIX family)